MEDLLIASSVDKTLFRFADAFHVNDIATYEFVTCNKNEDPQIVLDRYKDFDQIPTIDNDQIVGVIERYPSADKKLSHMHLLDDGILVSADETLSNFLPILAKPPFYRLVLKGSNIQGIVTKSDMLKIPVRMFSFALITQLELLMIDKIKARFVNCNDWLDHYSPGRREKITQKCEIFKKDRMDPLLVEFTDFSDKRTILKKTYHLKNGFEVDLKQIEKLRDKLADAVRFIDNNRDLIRLIDTLQKCSKWINNISNISE